MENEVKVGVIVGRFQVAQLTTGHKEIFEYVLSKNHNQNIVVLGVAPSYATKNNPLDFDSRRRMIEEAYPGKFTIMYIKDEPSDQTWSNKLDLLVKDVAGNCEAILYGSRDSFVQYYKGKLEIQEYIQKVICSGTDQRFYAGKRVQNCQEWRMGVAWATQNQYDKVYPTVDCCIFHDKSYQDIYLARKANEKLLRFVGGFVDPKDESYEAAANREAREETGLEVRYDGWIGSAKIDDWRYRGEKDKIITNFFSFIRVFGVGVPQDDIAELHKVKLKDLTEDQIQPEHRVLFNKLKNWLSIKLG